MNQTHSVKMSCDGTGHIPPKNLPFVVSDSSNRSGDSAESGWLVLLIDRYSLVFTGHQA